MASTHTSVLLSKSQRRRKSTQQREQDIIKAIDVAIDGLVRLDWAADVAYHDRTGEHKLMFTDVKRYVALENALFLLGDYKSHLKGTDPVISYGKLLECIHDSIRTEETKRMWSGRCDNLTVDERKQIIIYYIEDEHLSTLLRILVRAGNSDLVSELIKEARIFEEGDYVPGDYVQAAKLRRLCIERLVDY